MSTTLDTDVCRITVTTPRGRFDLVVPVTTTVAALVPVLVRHAGLDHADGHGFAGFPGAAWTLQRLGDAPFEPSGTPASLDWLEGEDLLLRPVSDPLPELDFDDLADGIATVVNRRSDRWQPEHRRILFLWLSGVALLIFATVLTGPLPTVLAAIAGFVMAAVLIVAAVLVARLLRDRPLSLIFGLASAACAGLAAAGLADGVADVFAPDRVALSVGAAGVVGVTAVLLAGQRLWAPELPYPPVAAVGCVALVAAAGIWLGRGLSVTDPAAAGIVAVVAFCAVVFVPKIVLRMAGLRGVQLPKNGEELKFDNEPQPAADLARRADVAENYLSVVVVSAAVSLMVLNRVLMSAPGWAGWTTVTVLSSTVLLRARSFLGLWARVSLVAAGVYGYVLVLWRFASVAQPAGQVALMTGLMTVAYVLVLAVRRPWPRRLLPIWEFLATVLDVITGLALIPLVIELLGGYAWARGLFG